MTTITILLSHIAGVDSLIIEGTTLSPTFVRRQSYVLESGESNSKIIFVLFLLLSAF